MAKEEILLSDGTDQADKSVIHTIGESIELGRGDDGFADGTMGWQWALVNAAVTESGGKLALSHAGSISNGYETVSYDVVGDFSFQVDFDSFSQDSGTNNVMARLFAVDSSAVGAEIWRQKSSTVDRYQSRRFDPGASGATEVASTDTSGKLRIDRAGDTFIMYYWNVSSGFWEVLTTYAGLTTAAVQIKIILRVDSGTTGSVNYDNVQFNTCGAGIYDASSPSPNSIPWNTFDTGLTMDMSTIDIFEYGAGSQEYQYAKNNGALNGSWLTLAQLQAESDFTVTHANSLKIQVRFVSTITQTNGVNRRGSIESNAGIGGGRRPRIRGHNV